MTKLKTWNAPALSSLSVEKTLNGEVPFGTECDTFDLVPTGKPDVVAGPFPGGEGTPPQSCIIS